jgi:hypothetical protein
MKRKAATIGEARVRSRTALVSTLVAVAVIQWMLSAGLRAQNPTGDSKPSTAPLPGALEPAAPTDMPRDSKLRMQSNGPGSIPDPNGAADNAGLEKQSAPASEATTTAQPEVELLVPVAVDPSVQGEASGASGPASVPFNKPERQLPSTRFGVTLTDVPELGLPALDNAALLQEDAQSPATCKRLRISLGRDLLIGPDDGRWTTIPGVGQLWTAEIVSQNALGIRIHFTQMNLPRGALLFVYSPTLPGFVNGPYQGVGPVGDGQFWAAVVEGERARIELFIPDAGAPAKPVAAFRIDRIQHLYRDPLAAAPATDADQGVTLGSGCHNDVTCYSAWTNVSHSVARIDYVDGGNGFLCTGQLLNPQNGDLTPYFLTANHCINNNAAAQSIQFYWFYQTSTCNGSAPSLGSVPKSLVGTLLSNSATSDYSLIMEEGALPCGVFWNGWTSEAIPNGEASAGVHHPGGQPTKISFGTRATADNSFCSSGNPNFMRENWSDGITEGGSSGSGIYRTSDQRLYGQLFCGPSSCGAGGLTYDNYGAFARTYGDHADVQTFLAGGSDDAFEPNDTCAAAITIGEGFYAGRVVRSSRDDWFRVNIPAGGTLAVSLGFTDANGDIDMQLFNSCGGSAVASSTGAADSEFFAYNNTGGSANFFLRVYLADCDTRNSYNMSLSATLENDSCGNATVIPPNTTTYNPAQYSTVAADASGSEPQESCEFNNSGVSNTVWYTFTPCGSGTINVNTIGSNYDTVLSIFSGSCGAATQVACNDDIGGGTLQSQLTNVSVTGGVAYLIKVADYNLTSGGGNLAFHFSYTAASPGNDLCANASIIPSGITTFNPAPYCTVGATMTGGDPTESCGFTTNSNSVWYRFTACGSGTISVDTNGSDYDTVLAIFSGTCGSATEVACDDDGGTGANSQLTAVPITAGTSYLIKISDYNTPDGGTLHFNFSYAPVAPANDSCSTPTVIPGDVAAYSPGPYCTIGADATLAEPQESCESGNVGVSNSVWYSWTPCTSGTISLDTIGSDYDTVLSVFSGTCASPTQVACDDDGGGGVASQLVNVPVTGGTAYLIKVADYSTPNGGTLLFHFSFAANAPSNDLCPAATAIMTNTFNPPAYCTLGATTTGGEPAETCGVPPNSNSVWYRFVPTSCGRVNIDTIGSDYDTVLSIFSGSCAAPVSVACDDDTVGAQSQLLNVKLIGGTAYLIKVADFNAPDGGTLSFHFAFTPVFLGDMNCDGCINTADVQAMVLALTNPAAYAATYPGCNILRGDTNGDSLVNGRDIQGFTNLVLAP